MTSKEKDQFTNVLRAIDQEYRPDEKTEYFSFEKNLVESMRKMGIECSNESIHAALTREGGLLWRMGKGRPIHMELGNPKKNPGEDLGELIRRVFSIDESNVCARIDELRFDVESGELVGKFTPAGPRADVLNEHLGVLDPNTHFSVRVVYHGTNPSPTAILGIDYTPDNVCAETNPDWTMKLLQKVNASKPKE